MSIEASRPGNVAVITGGASGIGLAAVRKFLALGLKVCIADKDVDRLMQAGGDLATAEDCLITPCDVAEPEALRIYGERFTQFLNSPDGGRHG